MPDERLSRKIKTSMRLTPEQLERRREEARQLYTANPPWTMTAIGEYLGAKYGDGTPLSRERVRQILGQDNPGFQGRRPGPRSAPAKIIPPEELETKAAQALSLADAARRLNMPPATLVKALKQAGTLGGWFFRWRQNAERTKERPNT
jgi:hypothetical protein